MLIYHSQEKGQTQNGGDAALPKSTACIAAVMTGEELHQLHHSAQFPLPIGTAQLKRRTLPGSLCAPTGPLKHR